MVEGNESPRVSRRARSDTLRNFVNNVFDDDEPVAVLGGDDVESELLSSSMVLTGSPTTTVEEGRLRGVSTFSSFSNTTETRPRGLSNSIVVTDEGVESMVKWAGDIFSTDGEQQQHQRQQHDETPEMQEKAKGFCLLPEQEQVETPEMLSKRVSSALASVKAARLEKKRQKSILIP
eukprot:TRINITY_DN6339_c0_g2_i1.p2 TRINITY_DN6339_c0_g2~~TRINITY_DN6339_c0_g2_i1.p2  ORF type:complete len:177 (+),score=48.05 TRINITY_DN6339_c0_g2_i1:83-613(+)